MVHILVNTSSLCISLYSIYFLRDWRTLVKTNATSIRWANQLSGRAEAAAASRKANILPACDFDESGFFFDWKYYSSLIQSV